MIAGMKTITEMYKELLKKRLERKKQELSTVEESINMGGVVAVEKKKYIELKAVINELESIIDMAETMFEKDE